MKPYPKKRVLCLDGPFKGRNLWLATDRRTLTFRIKGQVGFYSNGRWTAL
jgi:hypothetical protein